MSIINFDTALSFFCDTISSDLVFRVGDGAQYEFVIFEKLAWGEEFVIFLENSAREEGFEGIIVVINGNLDRFSRIFLQIFYLSLQFLNFILQSINLKIN